MGRLVKALGAGLGLASEAVQHARSRSRSNVGQSSGAGQPNASQPTSSSAAASQQSVDDPPSYYEATDDANASTGVHSRGPEYADEKSHGKSKAAEAGYSDEDSDSDEDEVGEDEAAWELDEMAERVAPPSYDEASTLAAPTPEDSEEMKVKKEEQIVRTIVSMAGPIPTRITPLPCPVIIPQKRPRAKDRGFVRAYAPVLADCGISQDVFLKFLTDWVQASKADPWIDIVFIAAGVVGMVPEIAAQITGTVVQIAAGTARELQSRSRRNTFLSMMNQQLFMPRGLFAMVMAFKDEVPGQQSSGPLSRLSGMLGKTLISSERLDINQTAAKYSNPSLEMSKIKKGLQNIRLTDGKTYGQLELPEAAELVYPDLDRAVQAELNQEGKGKGPEKSNFKDKMKGAGDFVQDYLDRRAQAQYASEHQGSALAVPDSSRAPFKSRFSDPNHPANSGSLISLLTGGAVNPAALREAKRAAKDIRRSAKREYKDQRRMARGRSPRGPRRARKPRGKRQGTIKKMLQQDVLYFIIVNLPTESEIQDSVAILEAAMTNGR